MKARVAPAMTTCLRIIVLLPLMLAAADPARAACRSSCTMELRACRTRCARDHGAGRRECRRRCAEASTCSAERLLLRQHARGRTGAYVVIECRNDADGFSLRERLDVRRGNCDPVTVMSLPPVGPVPDPSQSCRLYGQYRVSFGSVIFGRFQRMGMMPDGTGVIVEVTNDHAIAGLAPVPEPPEEGIFFVPTDGKPARWISPPSARKIVDLVGTKLRLVANPYLAVSPHGRYVAYGDRGPDVDGKDADQIVVIDLTTDERRQVTHLPDAPVGHTGDPAFVDDRTIVFSTAPLAVPSRFASTAASSLPSGA